jgi:hypothetical protein
MNSQGRHRWLLIAAVACIVLLAGDRFILTPLMNTWKQRAMHIEQLEQSIENGELLLERSAMLEDRWAEANEAALPTDAAQAENLVLNAVNDWGGAAGFNITALKPRWMVDEELGPRLEIRVSGGGSLTAVSRFLYMLETDSLPLRLEDVELRARDDRGAELSLEARFSGLLPAAEENRS